jgi:hypothetical protein
MNLNKAFCGFIRFAHQTARKKQYGAPKSPGLWAGSTIRFSAGLPGLAAISIG